mmetsp:Transcript_28149/g.89975  ORF Transcript_28149/g.89975 Transcript_28149/m.89975 type:complete len:534 (+) Transcript_28149:217-1818(+)
MAALHHGDGRRVGVGAETSPLALGEEALDDGLGADVDGAGAELLREHRRLLHPGDHLHLRLDPGLLVVDDALLLAEGLDDGAHVAQVVARNAREEVVLDLELQPAVEPVDERVADDVLRRAQLHAVPVVVPVDHLHGVAVVRLHREVAQADLHVQQPGDDVAHEREAELRGRRRAGHGRDERDVPRQEEHVRHHLVVAVGHLVLGEEADPALHVEVEARQRHDGVVEPVLVRQQHARRGVEGDVALLVAGEEAELVAEDLGRHGEDGHVLDVRVVLHGVAHHVVHVVRVLPPVHADAGEQVADDEPRREVLGAHVGDAVVAHVVAEEGALLPEEPHHEAREDVLAGEALGRHGERDGGREEEREPRHQLHVVGPARLEHALLEQALLDAAEPQRDLRLLQVRDVADVVVRQHGPVHLGRVEAGEGVRGVLSPHVLQCLVAPRVPLEHAGHIVDLAVDDHPQIILWGGGGECTAASRRFCGAAHPRQNPPSAKNCLAQKLTRCACNRRRTFVLCAATSATVIFRKGSDLFASRL